MAIKNIRNHLRLEKETKAIKNRINGDIMSMKKKKKKIIVNQ